MKKLKLQKLFKRIKKQKEILVAFFVALTLSGLTTYVYVRTPVKVVDSTSGSISVDTAVGVESGLNSSTAFKQSTIDWQKEIKPSNQDDPISDGYVIERIDTTKQDYLPGHLDIPAGWTAEWSTSPAGTAEENIVWQPTEPASGVTFIRLNTGDRDSFKPGVQTSLLKPLSNVDFDRPNYRPSEPVLYKRKIYQVMMAINFATTPAKYTLDCFNLENFTQCEGYPKYLSSIAGTDLSSTQVATGISTPMNFQPILDEGQYGNEGRLYIPAQQGNNYGINCIDLSLQQNCGFTVMGSSAKPTGTINPALIAGFVQKDDRLYGHANDADVAKQTMVCFDLDTDGQGADGLCPEYNQNTLSSVNTYKIDQHNGNYRTPGSHVLSGNRIYWQVNYSHAMGESGGISYLFIPADQGSQGGFGYVLACYDVVARTPCAINGQSTGFSHPIGGSPAFTSSSDNFQGRVRGYGTFVWKKYENNQYIDNAICTLYGMGDINDQFNPDIRCFNKDTGVFISTVGSRKPPNIMPNPNTNGWLLYPWQSAPNIKTFTGSDGNLKSYFPMYSTFHNGPFSLENLAVAAAPDATINKGATICYDWKLQATCDGFADGVRYWHEVNDGNSADVGYIYDGECTWATGLYGDIWSFNSTTGEYPCRSSKIKVNLNAGNQSFHCDGIPRMFSWDRVRLAKSSMYDYESFIVTVKNTQGDVIKQGNIKELGYLNINDIDYNNNNELNIEVVPTVLNTSPWANNNKPLVSGILNAEEVQYCYKTKVKDKCNLKNVSTLSSTNVNTETDILTKDQTTTVPVNQPEDVQCFQDLRAKPSVTKDRIQQNDTFSYSVVAENKANTDPNNLGDIPSAENPSRAQVEITIPSGIEYVSSSPAGASQVDNKIVWANQAVPAAQSKTFTVNLRSSPTIASLNSSRSLGNILYAATIEQSATITSNIIYSGDNVPSDNTGSTTVTLVAETTEESPPEESTEDPFIDEPTEIVLPGRPDSPQSTGGGTLLTPSFIRNVIPPSFANQTEQFFKLVNTAIQPIPNNVAVAIPYASIAFLVAFALIYIYQAVQEARNRRQLLKLKQRYENTEELRKNYIDLTSHYLNTPIAKMQTTLDFLSSNKTLPASTANSAKQRIAKLTQHAKMLLSTASDSGDHKSEVLKSISKRSSIFSSRTLLPIIGVLIVTILINALFVWAEKYDATRTSLIIQSSFYVLSAITLFIAYNRFTAQKFATEATQKEISLEKQLSQSQSNFIKNTSKTLEDDLIELSQLSSTIADIPKSEGFTNGMDSLKNAVNKLGYLNNLTSSAVVPTIPNQTIKDIAYEVINNLKPYADERGISLDIVIEPGLTVLVDIDGFKQLIESTVHNAIKFSKAGGNVEISMKRLNKDNVEVIIKDNGTGIAKDKIDQLFKPFGRATDSREYNYEGIGIDLYMDKLIAEQCGGAIHIESEVNKGTTVKITLPS